MTMIKKITQIIGSALLALALPLMVSAQQFDATGGPFGQTLINVITFANNRIIPFILGIGFLVFVWGMFKYFIMGGDDEDKRSEGKNLIIYATAGFVIIFIFWGAVTLLTRSTGLSQQTLPTNLIPNAPSSR